MARKTLMEKDNLLDRVRLLPSDRVLAAKVEATLKGKKFKTSLTGFRYREGRHEASRYLFNHNSD